MSVTKNFLYSSLLTSAGYLFPLITFPYVSRVLGVTNIGIVNFVDSIISYFVLFSMMGIRTIGIREIAKSQNNQNEMSQTFYDIVFLNLLFVLLSGAVLLISIEVVPQFAEHRKLMYVGAAKLLSSLMLLDWLYKGVEDFKFITLWSLIVRVLFVISIFVFVRNEDDYPFYFALIILTELVNGIINCIHARKYIILRIKNLHLFKYMKSSLTLGAYYILTTMYTTFNVTFLGFVTNTTEVGYYTTATKLHHIILSLFTAFTGVMLPRMSNLLSNNKRDEFTQKIKYSYSLLVLLSFPFIVWGFSLSAEIIRFIAGAGYENAAVPLMIIMPLVFIIGYEQILVIQVLIPLKKDKAILVNSILGATVGIVANLILVSQYGCVGSAIVWLISELCVMASSLYFVNKEIHISGIGNMLWRHALIAIPAFAVCIIMNYMINNYMFVLIATFIFVVVYYGYIYWYVLNDEFIYLIKLRFNTFKGNFITLFKK